jgi:hypothetical protein
MFISARLICFLDRMEDIERNIDKEGNVIRILHLPDGILANDEKPLVHGVLNQDYEIDPPA